MIPSAFDLSGLKSLSEETPHFEDSACDHFELLLPLLFVVFAAETHGDQSGPMNGRVGVHSSGHQFQLGHHYIRVLLAGAGNVQGPDSLSVETEVFREGLCHHHLQSLLDEYPDALDIFLQIATGIALVGRVEKGQKASLLEQLGHFLPLLQIEVDSGGVVGAGMQ